MHIHNSCACPSSKILCAHSSLPASDFLKLQKKVPGEIEQPLDSPRSNYSSAWETSESDVDEALDLDELQETRPSPTTIFEDNQAKMAEKGAKGVSLKLSIPDLYC